VEGALPLPKKNKFKNKPSRTNVLFTLHEELLNNHKAGAMSPKIGDGFSVKSYDPEFQRCCFPAKGYVPDFWERFFGKAICPRISGMLYFTRRLCSQLLIDSTDGPTLLSKVLAQNN